MWVLSARFFSLFGPLRWKAPAIRASRPSEDAPWPSWYATLSTPWTTGHCQNPLLFRARFTEGTKQENDAWLAEDQNEEGLT